MGRLPLGRARVRLVLSLPSPLPSTHLHGREVLLELAVDGAVRGKDVSVRFLPHTLRIEVQGALLLEGTLHKGIRPDDSLWELEGALDTRALVITLRKVRPLPRST